MRTPGGAAGRRLGHLHGACSGAGPGWQRVQEQREALAGNTAAAEIVKNLPCTSVVQGSAPGPAAVPAAVPAWRPQQ